MDYKWAEYTVEQLIEMDMLDPPMDGNHGTIHPKTTDYVEEGVPFIMANDLINGTVNFKTCAHITDKQAKSLRKGFSHPGDVLLTHKATIGRTAIVPDDYSTIILTPQVTYYRTKKGIYNRYLRYYFDSPFFQQVFNNWAGAGSTRAYLGITAQRKLPIILPHYDVQVKIAEILGTLDDKIELNNRINENLEQQAKSVFKSWFIDYDVFDEAKVESPIGNLIPESLEMVQIQDLPHILETGKRPKGGAVSDGIPSVGAENVKTLGVFDTSSAKYIPYDFACSMKKGRINGYELLLYKDGGKPGHFTPHFSMFGEGFPYEEFYINEHVFKLDFFDRGYNEFAYLYMQTDYPYHWLANNGGKAAIPGINQQDVNSIWIYRPDHPKVQEFCNWVQPLFTTIFKNCAQNMTLIKMRDSLLPKLMSGELDVSEIDI